MSVRHRFSRWMAAATLLLALPLLLAPTLRAAGPAGVLPAASAVKGWKQVGKTQLYNASNLFNLIDGEAQSVLGYSFAGCAHAEYAPAGQSRPALTVDVFDMSDPLNAYGLFGSDRLSGKTVGVGTEAVKIGASGLNFWKGRYVVRTAILKVDPATQAAQLAFAKAAAAKITGPSAMPPLVAALPAGRQPRSEKYVPRDVAGHAFVRNAITARYPAAGQGAELFIAQYPKPADAKAALERYRAYSKKGTGLTPLSGVGDAGFRVVDRYAKNVAVAQKGRYLVGVLRAREASGAVNLVKQAVAKVK